MQFPPGGGHVLLFAGRGVSSEGLVVVVVVGVDGEALPGVSLPHLFLGLCGPGVGTLPAAKPGEGCVVVAVLLLLVAVSAVKPPSSAAPKVGRAAPPQPGGPVSPHPAAAVHRVLLVGPGAAGSGTVGLFLLLGLGRVCTFFCPTFRASKSSYYVAV